MADTIMFKRNICSVLESRLKEKRRFIQIVMGPRQVGKTTAVQQVISNIGLPSEYASADQPQLRDRLWLEQQWELARLKAVEDGIAIFAVDEIQKVSGWSEVVKRLWDEDTYNKRDLRVVLLGSSSLLIQQGLTESLAGRFEIIHAVHWSLGECMEAFGWNLDEFIYFGGYPGAATLINEPDRWADYILNSLIETSVSRDILLLTRVDKPALLRRLFYLSCMYSGQILSYQKMLGQLQDAGNTTTLAHYLELLDSAGLVTGLSKFSGETVRRRGSSPKLQVYNTALITAQGGKKLETMKRDPESWGRLVESAVGAHLANCAITGGYKLYYWRERNREVDFVIQKGSLTLAIEVKSGRTASTFPGMDAFKRTYPKSRLLLVGGSGMPLEIFLKTDIKKLLENLGAS